jgi:FixJ family two-component response regulator
MTLRRRDVSLKTNVRSWRRVISPAIGELGSSERMISAQTRRVAVLDDDQSIGSAISRLLRTSNIQADSYVTCIELFNAVAQSPPDCLILDLQMPGMNGLDVMHYFANRGIHLPTIIITAHDEAGSRQSCLEAGAKAYLRKPLDAEELFRAIDHASEVAD